MENANQKSYQTDDLIPSIEAVPILGYSIRTIRNMLERGELEGTKINGRWMVSKRGLEAFKASH